MKIVLIIFLSLFSRPSNAQDTLAFSSDSIVSLAKAQIGVPYKWATSRPGVSFDCSGFTSYVYNSFDIPASRSSKLYSQLGRQVPLDSCQKGDCILFAGTQAGSRTIGHVGIVISNDENGIQFIHCSSSKKHFGVCITSYYNSNYPKRFLQIRRLY